MKLSDFDYILPSELIAQTPAEPRDSSRLLMLEKANGTISDKTFSDISEYLGENDVLVLNETRVIKARLRGYIDSKEKHACEIFLHKKVSEDTWDCLIYPGKKLKVGTKVLFESSSLEAIIVEKTEHGRVVLFSMSGEVFLKEIETIGETPLPPYIKDKNSPPERYQTVYGQTSGSVAAPTAGLHFTKEMLEKLEKKGVEVEKVLLHVGLGTFRGVETENIEDHTMHSEFCAIGVDTAERLCKYKKQGKRIIAVGTTSVRTLESFTDSDGIVHSGEKQTSIFIYPGYQWRFVDSIITNFHLPKSTLLMLVTSFAGEENIKKAYRHAIDKKYRFFSFGDALWIK